MKQSAVEEELSLSALAGVGQAGGRAYLAAPFASHVRHTVTQRGLPRDVNPKVVGTWQSEHHDDVCTRIRPNRDAGLFHRLECDRDTTRRSLARD